MAAMPRRTAHIGIARSVRTSSVAPPSPRSRRRSSPNACRVACTITGDILRIERMPAAKIPPIPIGRTYWAKIWLAGMVLSGSAPTEIAPGTYWPR